MLVSVLAILRAAIPDFPVPDDELARACETDVHYVGERTRVESACDAMDRVCLDLEDSDRLINKRLA